jgi:hypothetical protein
MSPWDCRPSGRPYLRDTLEIHKSLGVPRRAADKVIGKYRQTPLFRISLVSTYLGDTAYARLLFINYNITICAPQKAQQGNASFFASAHGGGGNSGVELGLESSTR